MKVTHFPAFICSACDMPIGKHAMMHSSGTCPLCGNSNNSTVVDCYKRIYKKTEIRPWWKVWSGPRYEFEVVADRQPA